MNRKILTISFLAIAFIFALVLGSNVAAGDYESLTVYAVIAIVVYFVVHGWKNVWWLTALLAFSGFVFVHGFVFDAKHLFIMMLVLASIISVVNRSLAPQSRIINRSGGNIAAFFVGAFLLYGVCHFTYNLTFPYSQPDYSLKTSSKAYFEAFATMVGFFWLVKGPYAFRLGEKWASRFIVILGLAVLVNTVARGSLFLQGFQAADGLSSRALDSYFLHIPVINMQAGIFTLRELCPIGGVILAMMLSTPIMLRRSSMSMKIFLLLVVASLLVGAIFSGGRVTLPFTLFLIGLVALIRKRVGLVIAAGMVAVLGITLANLFSDVINNKAPTYIARSLQYVMIEKGDSFRGISGSQRVRDAAYHEAIEIWKNDPRIFLTGRSVFSITGEEALYISQKFGNEGFVMNAMRSGRTHNLLSDLLLQYGLLGAILYFLAFISIIIFYVRLYRNFPSDLPLEKALCGAITVYLPFILIYQILGGQFIPIITALGVGILRARLLDYENQKI